MADDFFTQELEWLLRMRRESTELLRWAMRLRRWLLETHSVQGDRDVRRWSSPEAERWHEDLERLIDLLGTSQGRYLTGPLVTAHQFFPPPPLPPPPPLVIEGATTIDPNDRREIKGPGRRHGYSRRSSR